MASPEPDREDGNLPATEAGPDSGVSGICYTRSSTLITDIV